MNTTTPAPNWCFIGIKDTSDWTIPDKLKPYLSSVQTVYGFNRNLHAHLCEFTPSYDLTAVARDFEPSGLLDGLPQLERELIADEIRELLAGAPLGESNHYRHVNQVEDMIRNGAKFHEAGDIADPEDPNEDTDSMLCEYWNPNPRF